MGIQGGVGGLQGLDLQISYDVRSQTSKESETGEHYKGR